MTDELKQRQEDLTNELHTWFNDNNIYVSTDGVKRFMGILNRNKLLHDEWMDNAKKQLENAFTPKLRDMLKGTRLDGEMNE